MANQTCSRIVQILIPSFARSADIGKIHTLVLTVATTCERSSRRAFTPDIGDTSEEFSVFEQTQDPR